MSAIVHKYSLRAPLDWGADCDAQIAGQTTLWNTLVNIEQAHTATWRAVIQENGEAARLTAEYQAVAAQLDAAIEHRKQARKAARKRIETQEIDAVIAEFKISRKELAIAAKAARDASRDASRDKIRVLESERHLAVKAARNASGLYWGNYNAVCASYERGRSACLARGGTLRDRRSDGSGRITNQIQGGMSIDALFAGSHSQVQVLHRPDHPHRDKWLLTATVYRHGTAVHRTVTWPMIMERPLPADGTIKEIVVHRRRIEARWEWNVTFLCTVDDVERPSPVGPTVAVDLGWRKVDGGLRVATSMRDGHAQHHVLSSRIIEGLSRSERIRGHRNEDLDSMRSWLHEVPWHSAPADLQVIAAELRDPRLRLTFGRLAVLAIAWRKYPSWRPVDFEMIEDWRKRDKHLWLYATNGRRQAEGARLDWYRKLAIEIVDGTSAVILEDFDLAQTTRREGNPLFAAARHQRVLAAPHILRHWIKHQAAKRGIPVMIHKGVSTWLCSVCGTRIEPSTPADLHQTCPHCLRPFDQDAEACRNMLAACHASAPVTPEMPPALAAE